jgi:hypothetical protein
MKTFVRQKPANPAAVATNIDFGAASAQIARVLDPEVYTVRIDSARVVQRNQNTLIALDLVEVESGAHVAIQPIWVDGPNANAGRVAAENRHQIAPRPLDRWSALGTGPPRTRVGQGDLSANQRAEMARTDLPLFAKRLTST